MSALEGMAANCTACTLSCTLLVLLCLQPWDSLYQLQTYGGKNSSDNLLQLWLLLNWKVVPLSQRDKSKSGRNQYLTTTLLLRTSQKYTPNDLQSILKDNIFSDRNNPRWLTFSMKHTKSQLHLVLGTNLVSLYFQNHPSNSIAQFLDSIVVT